MIKRLLLIVLLTIIIPKLYACDLCGCNSGNYFIGPFPQFNSHFIGFQYSFQRYGTVLSSDHTQFSNDFYQTTELMARTNIRRKWQVLMFMPYHILYSKSDDGINQNHGFGDMTFMGNYNLLNRKYLNRDTETIFQQVWIGAGIKLPTGKFSVNPDNPVASANMQAGTGSFDYMVNLIYSFQIKSWGFNLNSNYRINQYADHYKFGNQLSITSFVFRSFHAGKVTISPNVGLLYEKLDANMQNHIKVQDTGGHIVMSAIGVEIRYKNIAFGCNDQVPLSSDLSNGQTDARVRGMCHLSYMF